MTPIVVLGPTASGKSDVAMAVAAAIGGTEIVAVDAMQMYTGMDIGTAKPTAADRASVTHHGLDLIGPHEEGTVAGYVAAVTPSIEAVARTGRLAVLVGGTGLYLRALTDPMELPGQWPEVRAELERRAVNEPAVALYRELEALDPLAASKIEPANVRRTVRALEVCRGSGRPFSSFGPGIDQYPPIPIAQIGIRWTREALLRRIEQRVRRMIDAGLVDEVRRLDADLAHRGLTWSRTARQALGYREVLDHLDGRWTLAETIDEIVLRTRQFAVRQERWFRRDPRVQWADVHADPVAEVAPRVVARLERET
jgi:tRNA dimethylallyltransferase